MQRHVEISPDQIAIVETMWTYDVPQTLIVVVGIKGDNSDWAAYIDAFTPRSGTVYIDDVKRAATYGMKLPEHIAKAYFRDTEDFVGLSYRL